MRFVNGHRNSVGEMLPAHSDYKSEDGIAETFLLLFQLRTSENGQELLRFFAFANHSCPRFSAPPGTDYIQL